MEMEYDFHLRNSTKLGLEVTPEIKFLNRETINIIIIYILFSEKVDRQQHRLWSVCH